MHLYSKLKNPSTFSFVARKDYSANNYSQQRISPLKNHHDYYNKTSYESTKKSQNHTLNDKIKVYRVCSPQGPYLVRNNYENSTKNETKVESRMTGNMKQLIKALSFIAESPQRSLQYQRFKMISFQENQKAIQERYHSIKQKIDGYNLENKFNTRNQKASIIKYVNNPELYQAPPRVKNLILSKNVISMKINRIPQNLRAINSLIQSEIKIKQQRIRISENMNQKVQKSHKSHHSHNETIKLLQTSLQFYKNMLNQKDKLIDQLNQQSMQKQIKHMNQIRMLKEKFYIK